jgi:hypothetical protein
MNWTEGLVLGALYPVSRSPSDLRGHRVCDGSAFESSRFPLFIALAGLYGLSSISTSASESIGRCELSPAALHCSGCAVRSRLGRGARETGTVRRHESNQSVKPISL